MIEINAKMPSMAMKDMKNKSKEDIDRLTVGLGVPLSVEERVLKEKGWMGKQKKNKVDLKRSMPAKCTTYFWPRCSRCGRAPALCEHAPYHRGRA